MHIYINMSDIAIVQKEVRIARSELKNIRQEVLKLRANERHEVEVLKQFLSKHTGKSTKDTKKQDVKDQNENGFNMIPIGYVSSCFKNKNGTPRQPALCQASKANLTINKTFFTNPEHSLIGLSEFSYIWILFVFHKNGESSVKAKIHPPRLNGMSTGVFSTRSPHRPCAIGLSLVKIEKIIGSTIFLSGVDILDGTPVLDIKPYIPSYDIPSLYRQGDYFSNEETISLKNSADFLPTTESSSVNSVQHSDDTVSCLYHNNKNSSDEPSASNNVSTENIVNSMKELLIRSSNQLEVLFTERAAKDIENFHFPSCDIKCEYCLSFIDSSSTGKQAISGILQNDPRSVYRKNKCSDKLYFFEVDNMHITCWFDGMIAEVLRVKPINKVSSC